MGGDLGLSGADELLGVDLVQRSQERVLRRLLIDPSDCTSNPAYGTGLPQMFGQPIDETKTASLITAQMLL